MKGYCEAMTFKSKHQKMKTGNKNQNEKLGEAYREECCIIQWQNLTWIQKKENSIHQGTGTLHKRVTYTYRCLFVIKLCVTISDKESFFNWLVWLIHTTWLLWFHVALYSKWILNSRVFVHVFTLYHWLLYKRQCCKLRIYMAFWWIYVAFN